MKTIPRVGWVLCLLSCFSGALVAQKATLNEDLVKADRQFSLYAYNLALQTYSLVLKEEPDNIQALAGIGDCYFQLNNPKKSLEWYGKAVQMQNPDEIIRLRYGKALLQTGDYEGAKEQFIAYAQKNQKLGEHYVGLCEYAEKYAQKIPDWLVKNESINTAFADFCPTFFQGKVVYNSSRSDLNSKYNANENPETAQNFLLVTQRNPDNGQLQKPQNLRGELQNNRNEGPASFSADGRRVAFCRNSFINGTRQIVDFGVNMSLYTAEVDGNGKWKNIKAFPFNGSNHATGFPALSPDGNTLLFSSNQQGGYGGWDIYVSNYKDGNWTAPVNLGYALNTPGNEVTPFYDGANLYFSSDWHLGFGGLDVFQADFKRQEVSNVTNLGTGANSSRDDYGFVFKRQDNIGYVTSTRPGGHGNEDIWKLTKKPKNVLASTATAPSVGTAPLESAKKGEDNALMVKKTGAQKLYLLVTNKTGQKIQGAEVDLRHCTGKIGLTGVDGHYAFEALDEAVDCDVVIRKAGYQETKVPLLNFGTHNVHIALKPVSKERFSGVVHDAHTNLPLRGVSVEILFQDGRTVDTLTNELGVYVLTLEPGTTYLINYNKSGYISQVSKTFLAAGMGRIPGLRLEKNTVAEKNAVAMSEKVGAKSIENPKVVVNAKPAMKASGDKLSPKQPAATPAIKVKRYAIQLAAMPEEPSAVTMRNFQTLTSLGNIYVRKEQKLNKIRLGIFPTKAEATVALKKVMATPKLQGAFLVEEYGAGESYIVGTKKYVGEKGTLSPTFVSKGGVSSSVYAVQVDRIDAAKNIAVADYAALRGLGNLYASVENGKNLVRLGVWSDYEEAERVKGEVVKRGFTKATVVEEKGTNPEIQSFLVSKTSAATAQPKKNTEKGQKSPEKQVQSTSEAAKPYFIRIAALSNPDRFDDSSLKGIGNIVKRKAEFSPGITILLLSGFQTRSAAEIALEKVVRKGYYDAFIMKEEKGKLIRL